MMPDNYTKAEAQLDFKDISEHISEEGLEGAAESEIVNPNSANLMTFNLCLCVICWFFLGTY